MSEAQYFQRTTSVGRGQESAEKKKCTWHTEYFKLYPDKKGEMQLCSVNECEDKTMWFSKPMPFAVPREAQPSTAAVYAAALARHEVVAAKKKQEADKAKAQRKQMEEMRAAFAAFGTTGHLAPVTRRSEVLPAVLAPEPAAEAGLAQALSQAMDSFLAGPPTAAPGLLDDFTVIDTEFVPEGQHLLEVAAIRYINMEPREAFVSFVSFEGHIPSRVTELTGITALHLHGAPSVQRVLYMLREYVGDSLLVCHNVPADRGVIEKTRARLGKPAPLPNKWLCTMALARKRYPKGQKVGLGDLCELLKIKRRGAHRAKADVQMTFQLLCKLHEKQPVTKGDLYGAAKPGKTNKSTPAGPGLLFASAA